MENNNKIETTDELLKKIQKLEEAHANLKQQMISYKQKYMSVSTLKMFDSGRRQSGGGIFSLTESQCENILQSMGQAVYMFDLQGRIVYWNRMSEILYGYTVAEALGKTAAEIIIEAKYAELATVLILQAGKGESWFGEFPVRNKNGKKFSVITTVTPSRDEYGTSNGALCLCADATPFKESRQLATASLPWRNSSTQFGHDPQQSLQTAIASKISNLASKIKLKMNCNTDYDGSDSDSYYSNLCPRDLREDASSMWEYFTRKRTPDFSGGSENRRGIHKVLSSKAEAWMSKKGIAWPSKGNENEGDSLGRFGCPLQYNDTEPVPGSQTSSSACVKVESQQHELVSINRAPRSGSSSGTSSSESTNINSVNKFHIDIDHLDVEISWNELVIEERIGQGSCGTVYHALWYGSDVAVKMFTKQEYSCDIILSFRKEVSLMKRLRHPNILLFMGSVTSPQHLCIVTEFLPRGSLFQLLQRYMTKLDWRRRVHMAMDIARGMNYLHQCHPPIIHRDLKSSNLLVDKNWTVKVGDFGLSRIKRETYLTTNTGIGTPQWMAPEILQNKQADEKSDVYSYGVVLWEITTGKIPWDNLNPIQVIGAVGFMNRRLEIPKDVNPKWASLVESCWSSEPQSRPTFREILTRLKDLQKKFAIPRRDNKS